MKEYKVIFADLDGTLIETISGETFPKGIWDMRIRFDVLDAKMQGQNKRNNIVIEINGESHILSEWCRILGVNRTTVKSRILQQGLTPYEAITIPIIKGNRKKLK